MKVLFCQTNADSIYIYIYIFKFFLTSILVLCQFKMAGVHLTECRGRLYRLGRYDNLSLLFFATAGVLFTCEYYGANM